MKHVRLDQKVGVSLKELYCPKKAILVSKMTVGQYIRAMVKNVDKFLLGTEAHSLVKFADGCRKEVSVRYRGYNFRIDAVCEDGDGIHIYEVKLSLGEKYREWYLWTLRKYMCMYMANNGVDRVVGHLVGILDMRTVTIEMDRKEAEKECEDMDRRLELFEKGIEEKNVGMHCDVCLFKTSCLYSGSLGV
ncbi:putative Cas4-like nuclease [Pyrobaculum filamentous virus 2]|uniref:Putative Cas4-like nuclease n=1 Tax=Pyrobaculum filamentous virus 2 TaxID=2730621 RepID=A0A6M3VZ80_PFV2|nr:putative Cas4-like nuclease [Pyrobaculum filamentous virus 2]QJF12385.1 putative Cas4-like nuclease [Pyrobaculum filamentous virus 2]